jgi:hypothetical protein
VLNANVGTSQAIYDDLGSGTRFGSFAVPLGAPTDVLGFSLNGAGVAAYNAARAALLLARRLGQRRRPDPLALRLQRRLRRPELRVNLRSCDHRGVQGRRLARLRGVRQPGRLVSYVAAGGRNGPKQP